MRVAGQQQRIVRPICSRFTVPGSIMNGVPPFSGHGRTRLLRLDLEDLDLRKVRDGTEIESCFFTFYIVLVIERSVVNLDSILVIAVPSVQYGLAALVHCDAFDGVGGFLDLLETGELPIIFEFRVDLDGNITNLENRAFLLFAAVRKRHQKKPPMPLGTRRRSGDSLTLRSACSRFRLRTLAWIPIASIGPNKVRPAGLI